MLHHKMYLLLVGAAFFAITAVFLLFPRSVYSELEKRELATFPDFTVDKLLKNEYPGEISRWFSDSEPFRDDFMTLSMELRHLFKLTAGNSITFHAPEQSAILADAETPAAQDLQPDTAVTENLAEENGKIAAAGIFVVGEGDNMRALMAFGGGGGNSYAQAMNRLKRELPGVRVYSMVIPLAIEFYCPDEARSYTRPQKPFVERVASMLSGVSHVDVYSALAAHQNEEIYLRTDHHWAPRGAFYAAEQLAHKAGVPFRQLSDYDERVVHGFVGSMYGYSNDITVKNSPEDFVYYVPRTSYSTTYINYSLDEKYAVRSESKPHSGPFFYKFSNGSSGAYNTFMGGDSKIVKVKTSAGNGRRLLIIKDSYGNAVPGYLFFSFEEIHVIDFRYFNKNIKQYIRDNRITDVTSVFNVFNAASSAASSRINRMLDTDPTVLEAENTENLVDADPDSVSVAPEQGGSEISTEDAREDAVAE